MPSSEAALEVVKLPREEIPSVMTKTQSGSQHSILKWLPSELTLMSAFTERSPSFRPMSSEVILTVGTADLIMVSVRLKKRKKKRSGKEQRWQMTLRKLLFKFQRIKSQEYCSPHLCKIFRHVDRGKQNNFSRMFFLCDNVYIKHAWKSKDRPTLGLVCECLWNEQ